MKNNELNTLKGKTVLITAGPTHEAIDPVRYIGNHSTGKMGYALAHEFIEQGARVILLSGPVYLTPPEGLFAYERVNSADELFTACTAHIGSCDIAVFAAAVADYKPVQAATQKIKSNTDTLILELKKTVDIAFELGKHKKPEQFFVGFALETESAIMHAQEKLIRKNLDLIVLNSLKDEGAGFGYDTNKISLIDRDNKIHNFGLKLKTGVARDIVQTISHKLQANEKN